MSAGVAAGPDGTRWLDRADYQAYCRGALADPYPLFTDLRGSDPVHWSEPLNAWLLTRYDDVLQGLTDPAFGSDRIAVYAAALSPTQRLDVALLLDHVSNWLGFTDPPKHTRLRKLLTSAFTPRLAKAMQPRIEAVTNRLLDEAEQRGRSMDLLNDLAFPLPAAIIYDLLGIPLERQGEFRRWVDDIVPFVGGVGPTLAETAGVANQAAQDLTAYFRSLVLDGELDRRTDLIAELAAVFRAGEMTEQELLGLTVFVFAAGHETTISLISSGLMLLLDHPAQLARLRDDWSVLPTTIEEALRVEAPVQISPRVALGDIAMRDRTIRKGSAVILANAAANHDPLQFPDPERFKIDRADNRHLSFGWARHFCLGAPLARMEAQVAFQTVLTRYPDLALVDTERTWLQNMSVRCRTAIPATF